MTDPRTAGSGAAMHAFASELYPICRSITGDGMRRTLRRIQELVPLALHEVPSGTTVFDWTVPREWNIREAWIANARGERVVDFRNHNLHVVGYSVPVRARMMRAELLPHLHTLPAHPEWIPYRTSYYADAWGFCLPHRLLETLPDGEYEVCIDSTLAPGSLTYGELFLPGESEDELLFSCHSCHPSLANDNLSGVVTAVWLARALASAPRRHGMRFVFIPGTIGAITWLARNTETLARVASGLVLTCVGDAGPPTYKQSRRGSAPVDRAAAHVLAARGPHRIIPFSPTGYDERQYCSPGIDLPMGCFMRTPNGEYPEYHSSADDLSLLRPDALEDSLSKLLEIVDVLDHDRAYLNLSPRGEPQLGRRGLYSQTGGASGGEYQDALLWVLNYSDGGHTLLDIAERSGLAFAEVRRAAAALEGTSLLSPVTRGRAQR